MRVCDKCSRDVPDGQSPDCDDPNCPLKDGLALLEGEDQTLIDPNFDREKALAMAAKVQAEEEQDAVPETGAATMLDQPPPDTTKLYEDEDDDLPEFVASLLDRAATDDDEPADGEEDLEEIDFEVESEVEDESGPEVASTQANTFRVSTSAEPAPQEGTTVEQESLDSGPSTIQGDAADADADADAHADVDVDDDVAAEEDEEDVADAPTGRMDGSDLDQLELEHSEEDETSLMSADAIKEIDNAHASTVEIGQTGFAHPLQTSEGDESADASAREHATTQPKPKLTLADLRASLKRRNNAADTSESISTLDEKTEDSIDQSPDRTADDGDAYDHDETAQMDAASVDGVFGVTSQDGTLQLDDSDILDFADELLDDEGRTIEMSKDLSLAAEELARSMSAKREVSTKESTRPLALQAEYADHTEPDVAQQDTTTPHDAPESQTIESLNVGAQPQPPQTYPQPHAGTAFPPSDPYGSGRAQYPPPGDPAGSGMFTPQGFDPAQPQYHHPPANQPHPPQHGDQPQPLIPYEQQLIGEKKGRRLETFVVLGIIVLTIIGIVLFVANLLR